LGRERNPNYTDNSKLCKKLRQVLRNVPCTVGK
jgi:hypothetical protein